MYLALDIIDAVKYPLPAGIIVGMNPTIAGLRNAGFSSSVYRGQRLRQIDTSDSAVWNNNCAPGWFYQNGAVRRVLLLTNSDQVDKDIGIFSGVFYQAESTDFQRLLAREKVDTTIDSGHSWVDDEIHSWIKPWGRLTTSLLAAEKASANPNPANYRDVLNAFLRQALTPGVIGFNEDGDRSVWRPLRTGVVAWEFDTDTGGTKAGTNRTVSYPDGLTVATWNFYAAVNAL